MYYIMLLGKGIKDTKLISKVIKDTRIFILKSGPIFFLFNHYYPTAGQRPP